MPLSGSSGRAPEPDVSPAVKADSTGTEPVGSPPFDLFVSGTVFLDLIFTGMVSPPASGREILTDGMGSSPGGAATLAAAASRLGLNTSLSAAFGSDAYGEYCWTTLADLEGVDLSHSQRFEDWHSPVTVSLAFDDDRAMVTHAHQPPVPLEEVVGSPPTSRASFADMTSERPRWVDQAVDSGSLVFADLGWDPTEQWDTHALRRRLEGCHAFTPNATEAMAFTQTDTPGAALEVIQDWVPLAVVTSGSGGAFAADADSGEIAWVPGVAVKMLDPTGAGDVFLAALIKGTLDGWPLTQRLRFANLCAAMSVRGFGGALAAPGWADLCDWWILAREEPRLARDYAFLEEILGSEEHRLFSHAVPTLGFRPAVHDHGRHGKG